MDHLPGTQRSDRSHEDRLVLHGVGRKTEGDTLVLFFIAADIAPADMTVLRLSHALRRHPENKPRLQDMLLDNCGRAAMDMVADARKHAKDRLACWARKS
ncbi:hypothetical protein [Thetidibacter halocola]|uniref:Uncharacterized protein n=1 Tax=Thetidibacter halocola TaxID=2827239 RepID=A0A8J7WJ22_9RHOB|nr:hypothetical protein [Thetidibacter halocola]MBS0126546.1 hypothetical protein [Thetidibacter halocola]